MKRTAIALLTCAVFLGVNASAADLAGEKSVLTLALKFVEFVGENGQPVLSHGQVERVTEGMNRVFRICGIQFRLEDYLAVNPRSYGLGPESISMDSLDRIRGPFDTPKELVVINTGAWNHRIMGTANAWTMMPGELPSGSVIEGPVADDTALVAHEMGHYLSLEHVSDSANMMNATIYNSSTVIQNWQCVRMRHTATTARARALRDDLNHS
jgi:hypothetical protein